MLGTVNGAINVYKVRNVCNRVFIFTKVAFIISVCARPVLGRGYAATGLRISSRRYIPASGAEALRAFSGR